MAKVSVDTVKSLINFLTKQGMDRVTLLAQVHLSESQLNLANKLINTSEYERLYHYAEKSLHKRAIGFEFGQAIEPDRWGILGYIAYTSPTLKAALLNQRKFQGLVGNLGTPLQEFKQDVMVLKWLPAYRCSHHTVEEIITGWATMAQQLCNQSFRPRCIYFSHSCQTELSAYQRYFNCDVVFDSDFDGIEVELSVLDIPLTKYNPEVNDLLCAHAAKTVNSLIESSPVEIITEFIRNQLPLGVPEIEDAAQSLQMSVRTLQRKLSDHQLTFSSLVDTIRKELAISYLTNTNTKIIYISQMLGFSEQSSFQRAFKRWLGQTPKQYREQH
ncbi:AraC family transcriptional regulator [Thalassotalea sp. G2M2-11]|uniref:AraC family transcriptional regulator n=1 Tax=Thalassotalea sp. G2M2-11 TaxID=2787627 RepID=UPI0019D0FC1E|nr:AraC family transcriptional regulator [Thalassotalea sp. G2M2-11]